MATKKKSDKRLRYEVKPFLHVFDFKKWGGGSSQGVSKQGRVLYIRSVLAMFVPTSRSEELRQCQAASVQQMERYEAKHLGGFRRIYPREGAEKYDKYFKHSSSLFQETAASKAREECARYKDYTLCPECANTLKGKARRHFISK